MGRATRHREGLERLQLGLILVGLAFSALLVVEYRSPGGVCSVGSGCDLVRASEYSAIAGISLPTLGVAYFLLLLVVSVVPAARGLLLPVAAAGAVGGAAFVAIQAFVVGAFCSFCLVVDAAALGLGATAALLRGTPPPPLTGGRAASVAVLALLAVGLPPFMVAGGGPAPAADGASSDTPPEFVARAQAAEGVTFVEFVDFECPACRAQHRALRQAASRVDHPVTVVYLHAPLPQHEHAADAARAYLCAEEAGHGPEMADALFSSDDLTMRGIERLAAELGIEGPRFARCLLARRTEERLERDLRYAREAGVRSLPTSWIGRERFVGVVEPAVLLESFARWNRGGN